MACKQITIYAISEPVHPLTHLSVLDNVGCMIVNLTTNVIYLQHCYIYI